MDYQYADYKQKIVVIIPIYKDELNENEQLSLHRCCAILDKYSICFVCYSSLNKSRYESICNTYDIAPQIEYFEKAYFENIAGYNRLLLTEDFYSRFQQYTYVLIYQLDAYVFKDELSDWCNLGYDYIGAPLIGNFTDTKFSNAFRVGNGGLSLRKIPTFINFFKGRRNVFNYKQILKLINFKKKPHTRIFVLLLMLLGWRNKPNSVAKRWKHNEDDFWSGLLDNSNYSLKKPEPIEAMNFAFERFPSNCYNITKKLPFGCHAWEKYEYETFWREIINNDDPINNNNKL